jgi:hypothetical protein
VTPVCRNFLVQGKLGSGAGGAAEVDVFISIRVVVFFWCAGRCVDKLNVMTQGSLQLLQLRIYKSLGWDW